MKVCLFIIFISFLSSIRVSFSDEFTHLNSINPLEDKKAFLKQAFKVYKQAKGKATAFASSPEYVQFLESKRREEIDEGSLCVGCPNLLLLTEQVNKILQEQKTILPKDTPASVLNEIDSLQGLFYFVQDETSFGVTSGCEKRYLGYEDLFSGKRNLNLDNHILLFTEKIDFKKITEVHLSNSGTRRTYFFKAREPNSDIVIKVEVSQRGPAEVSYYRHREIILKNKALGKIERERAKVQSGLRVSKVDDKLTVVGEEVGPEDIFEIDYGVETDGDSFIPKKVTLIGMSGVSYFESTTIRAGTEISSDKQVVELELSSKDEKDFVKVDIDASKRLRIQGRSDFESFSISSNVTQKSGKSSASVELRDDKNRELVGLSLDEKGVAKVGVPMQFNVYDTGILVDGRVIAGQDGTYGGTWVLSDRETKTRYVDIAMEGSKDGIGVSVGYSQEFLNDRSRISVKLSHDDFKEYQETAGWVQYSLKF